MARPQLTFLVHRGKDYTLRHYFKTWGAELRDRVAFKTYPGVGGGTTYVHGDSAGRLWVATKSGMLRLGADREVAAPESTAEDAMTEAERRAAEEEEEDEKR